jgi:hypothetical protein
MTDIVVRLRMNAGHLNIVERYTPVPGGLFVEQAHGLEREAAAEIERLRAENRRLLQILDEWADECETHGFTVDRNWKDTPC